jgi:hypothetical protein
MIPLVRCLLAAGARVTLAGSGATARLLSAEFPALEMLHLEGYGIRYPRNGQFFAPYLLTQVPKVYNAISREKVWLQHQLSARHWDWVISDNRYGLHNSSVKSILLTHQLFPRSGQSWIPDALLHRLHRRLMRPFDEIWVPDFAEGEGLSGRLSHPISGDLPVTYIGPLSRLSPEASALPEGLQPGKYLLALVSGPEPQRSIFEEVILAQAQSLAMPVVLLRGLPGTDHHAVWSGNVLMLSHAPATQLSALVNGAGWIVCRSGYSTLMDLAQLGRTAMLVPTPGQPEQEYLAGHMEAMGWFLRVRQDRLSLNRAMEQLSMHRGIPGYAGNASAESLLANQIASLARITANDTDVSMNRL